MITKVENIQTTKGTIEVLSYHRIKKDGTPFKRPSEYVAYLGEERVKKCTRCSEWKNFEEGFRLNKGMNDGRYSMCRSCERDYFKVYDNSPKGRVRFERRRKLEEGVSRMGDEYRDYVKNYFNGACAITGVSDEEIVLDHFIPLSWGCVGNEYGNLIPISTTLNKIKRSRSVFEVIEEMDAEARHQFYTEVLPFVAHENYMTVEEYTEFYKKMERSRYR